MEPTEEGAMEEEWLPTPGGVEEWSPEVQDGRRQTKVQGSQGSLLFITYTIIQGIISSEM